LLEQRFAPAAAADGRPRMLGFFGLKRPGPIAHRLALLDPLLVRVVFASQPIEQLERAQGTRRLRSLLAMTGIRAGL
jgi:hypothetical protein